LTVFIVDYPRLQTEYRPNFIDCSEESFAGKDEWSDPSAAAFYPIPPGIAPRAKEVARPKHQYREEIKNMPRATRQPGDLPVIAAETCFRADRG
jgi:hypothetical protein